jgi:uncharacterized repeat protein (TIGR01451 family)
MGERRMSWRGPLATVAAVAMVCTAGGIAQAAPAVAQQKAADVAVDLSADPALMAVGNGTTITATVRNQGDRPARQVKLTITLPSAFDLASTSSTSDLPCTSAGQVVTCEGGPDLAAHATEPPVSLFVEAFSSPPGTTADFDASVTTGSRESDTTNNTATQSVHIVGVGTVQGNVWNDLNGDGQRESGEPPLNDITSIQVIYPEDGGGQYIANIFDGFYEFEGVRALPNIIRVTVSDTGPWTFTTPDVGDDATDSDITGVSDNGYELTGESAPFDVTAGGVATIDIGLVAKSPA